MKEEYFEKLRPIITKNNRLIVKWKTSQNPVIQQAVQELIKLTSFLPEYIDMKIRLYFVLHDLKEFPICRLEGCTNPVKYYSGRLTQYCSDEHRRIGSPFVHNIPHTIEGKQHIKDAIEKSGGRSGNKNNNYGHKASEETRKKQSIARSKWKHSKTHIENWIKSMAKNAKERGLKISKTYKEKQINYPEKIVEIIDKQHRTKRKNNSFNQSRSENILFNKLSNKYPFAIRNYKNKRYPFLCDFYIPELDLFIEYNEHWTHGGELFNLNDELHLDKLNNWRNKNTKFFNNAIKVWTKNDPLKFKIAQENKINYLILWSLKDVERFLTDNLSIKYTKEACLSELQSICNLIPSYDKGNHWNKIILTYQPHFYEKEKELWRDSLLIRAKLLMNRNKYLHKKIKDLSDYELLSGFKKSGLHYGFSHASPAHIKKFIQDYNIKSIYDPFGGWGHRLLGSGDITYIYNDIDPKSFNGVTAIIKDFNLVNKICYNEDSSQFTPKEDYKVFWVYYRREK